MKNNNFKENFIPAIVLVCICLVVSLALAATYNVANPTIIRPISKNPLMSREWKFFRTATALQNTTASW